jgi:hypothetical protein
MLEGRSDEYRKNQEVPAGSGAKGKSDTPHLHGCVGASTCCCCCLPASLTGARRYALELATISERLFA